MSSTSSSSNRSRENPSHPSGSDVWPEESVVKEAILGKNLDKTNLQRPRAEKEVMEITPAPSQQELEECLSSLPLTKDDQTLVKDQDAFSGKVAYSSFGDKGTTATVNKFGDILQISRYLGVSKAGFFCVDPGESNYHYAKPTPSNIVNRAQWLSEMSTFPAEGIGLRLGIPRMGSAEPTLGYINNRWPRITRVADNFDITVQYFVKNGVIIQQCIIKRRQTKSQDVPEAGKTEKQTQTEEELPTENTGRMSPDPTGTQSQELSEDNTGIGTPTNQRADIMGEPSKNDLPPWPELRINTNFFIRTLNSQAMDSAFNKHDIGSDEYKVSRGPRNFSIIAKHQGPFDDPDPETDENGNAAEGCRVPDSVALVMMPFVNGNPQRIVKSDEWNENGRSKTYLVPHNTSIDSNALEVTVAYRLQLMEETAAWKSRLVAASDLDMHHSLSDELHHRISLSSSPYLNFVLNRTLEHILSVCSVPIPEGPIWDFDKDGNPIPMPREWKVSVPIALTCGDISDHFLVNSASFFAFKFLMRILDHVRVTTSQTRLKVISCFDQIVRGGTKSGANQIFQELLGLIDSMTALGVTPDDRKRAALENSQQAKTSEMELQLGDVIEQVKQKMEQLKEMLESLRTFQKWEARIARVCRLHLRWVFESAQAKENQVLNKYWASRKAIWGTKSSINPLDTAFQILKAEAFDRSIGHEPPKTPTDPYHEFGPPVEIDAQSRERQAKSWIRTLQERDNQDYFIFGPPEHQPDHRYRLSDHVWIWAALKALENANLATSNDTRTYTPKSAHNLRIYTPDLVQRKIQKRFTTENLISKRRMTAVWRSARESSFQLNPEDTALFYYGEFFVRPKAPQDGPIPEWVNTIDAQVHHRENQDSEWSNPMQYGLAILMANQKEQMNSRPASEMFNVATNILLRSCFPNGLFPGRLSKETKAPEPLSRVSEHKMFWHASFELPYIFLTQELKGNALQSKREGRSGVITPIQETRQRAIEPVMSAILPFRSLWDHQNFVNRNNLSEYSDPWLYKCPEFLNYKPEQPPFDSAKTVPDQLSFIVYDRDDTTSNGGITIHELQGTANASRICKRRTDAQEALIRKRFIWIPSAGFNVVQQFLKATHNSDRQSLQSFFERHLARDKFFLDDPTAADNTWLTEFHLSFFKLCDAAESHISPVEGVSLEKGLFTGHPQRKVVRRGVLGFRFHGDFFDRYWTCHLVGAFHNDTPEPNQGQNTKQWSEKLKKRLSSIIDPQVPSLPRAGDQTKTRFWTQRKVLELLLFDEVLKEVIDCTQQIIVAIKYCIRGRKSKSSAESQQPAPLMDPYLDRLSDANFFSDMNTRNYFSLSKRSQMLGRILEELEEDLSETISKIASWERREGDRGPEQPRWTMKDERRYRPALRKVLLSNNQQVRRLQQLHATVQSLKASLTSERDSIRDDLGLRGSEDVRYFTYVTVVFLPLGFAASIFSMSGSPPQATLRPMVVTAVVALVITTVILYATHLYHNQKLAKFAYWAREKWEVPDEGSERQDNEPEEGGNLRSWRRRINLKGHRSNADVEDGVP